MFKRATAITACLLALGAATACGDEDGNDANVTACKDWVKKTDALTCGATDFSAYTRPITCSAYADIACDFSEYFNCLYTNTKCKEVGTDKTKTEDLSGWPTCYDTVLKKCNGSE